MKSCINWKIFTILLVLSLISVICIFPYVLTVQSEVLSQINIPIEQIFVAQFVQSIILFSITIFFGLNFTKKINFQLPLFETIVKKENFKSVLKNILGNSIIFGIITAVVIYALDFLFAVMGVSISTHQSLAPAWQTLLAAFYGGITEEILMRLFLMTFLIWVSMKISKRNQPTRVGILISMVLAAIIFGLGHLPITASLAKIDALVVSRAIVLNGIGGVIFGWLFWKKGLESAIIAHFTTDIFLLTLLPTLIK